MAQQYTAAPPYGGLYTPTQSYYPPFQQTTPQQPAPTPPVFSPNSTQPIQGYQASPVVNAGRFEANAQNRPSVQTYPFQLSSFNPEIFKQFANSNLPPPPPPNMPLAPTSNFGNPQFAPANTASPMPYLHSGIGGQDGRDLTAYNPRFPQGVQQQVIIENSLFLGNGVRYGENQDKAGAGPVLAPQNLSQGFLNFGHPGHVSPQSVATPHPYEHSTLMLNDIPNGPSDHIIPATINNRPDSNPYLTSSISQHQLVGSAEVKAPQQMNGSASAALERPVSSSSYKPPSPGVPQRQVDPVNTVKSSSQLSQSKPTTEGNIYGNKSAAELRQLAKGALLSLIPHNIHYNDLIKEAINKQVLQELYSELGIKVDSEIAKTVYGANTSTGGQARSSSQTYSTEVASSAMADATMTQNAIPEQYSAPSQTTIKPGPVPSPNLERKDRIAQLLAAKTGRPSPVRSTSGSQPSSTTADLAVTQPKSVEVDNSTEVVVPADSVNTPQFINTTPMQSGKVPSDFLKQKMNQPKIDTEVQTRLNLPPNNTSTNVPDSLNTQPLPSSLDSGNGEITNPATLPAGFASMIPGLFMTSTELSRQNQVPGQTRVTSDHPPFLQPFGEQSNVAEQFRPNHASAFVEAAIPPGSLPPVSSDEMIDDDASEGEIIEAEEDENQVRASSIPGQSQSAQHKGVETRGGNQPIQKTSTSNIQSLESTTASDPLKNPLKRIWSEIDSQPNPDGGQAKREYSKLERVNSNPEDKTTPRVTNDTNTSQPDSTSSRPITKLTPAQMAEKAAALKAEFLRQRAQRAARQKALQEGLPDLNAEIEKTRSRLSGEKAGLSDIRKKIEDLESQIQQARINEREVLDTIAQLETQLIQGLSGQKQFSDELKSLNSPQSIVASTTDTAVNSNFGINSSLPPTNPPSMVAENSSTVENLLEITEQQHHEPKGFSASHSATRGLHENSSTPSAPSAQRSAIARSAGESDAQNTSDGDIRMLDTQDSEDSISHGDQFEQQDYMDDSKQNTSHVPSPSTEGDALQADDESDGSASMSDSGSDLEDEYEPADVEVESTRSMEIDNDSDEYEPEEVPTEDDRAYEPAGITDTLQTPASSTSGGQAMDSGFSSEDPNRPASVTRNQAQPSHGTDAISATSLQTRVDDTEHGLQLTDANIMIRPHDAVSTSTAVQPLSGDSNSTNGFTQYQSPLASFKSYRYNQQFADAAKQGFRSLTYSNNIDPSTPLCLTELSGEVCTDPNCEEQHFRHLGLTDDKILVQMSSASDIKDKGLRERYLLGLRKVIAELREKGVKDFENVATALSAYRRQFYVELEEAP